MDMDSFTKMEVWKDGFTDKIEYKKLRGTEKESEPTTGKTGRLSYRRSKIRFHGRNHHVTL